MLFIIALIPICLLFTVQVSTNFVKSSTYISVDRVVFEKEKDDKSRVRFSSFVEEQIAIIDKYNDPLVTACWDTGHGNASYGYDESIEAMKLLGSRLTSTHIHDNYYKIDLHCPVFLGNTKWEKCKSL